jgi:hypothetical protein
MDWEFEKKRAITLAPATAYFPAALRTDGLESIFEQRLRLNDDKTLLSTKHDVDSRGWNLKWLF